MSGTEPTLEERATAFHEAGHAVAHLELNLPLRWVTVIPDAEAGNEGSTAGGRLPSSVTDWLDGGRYGEPPLRVRHRLEREIMATLAGEIAQEKATGTTEGSAVLFDHPDHGTLLVDGDWRTATERASWLGADEETGHYLAWLRARTASLFGREEVWCAVEAVAAALLARRHLSGREVRAVRDEALGRMLDAWRAARGGVFGRGAGVGDGAVSDL